MPSFKFVFFSKTFFINNSEVPGYTVDSKKIISPFFKFFATNLEASNKELKLGMLFLLSGVGTVIIKKLLFFKSLIEEEKKEFVFKFNSLGENSLLVSIFFLR